MCADQTLPSFPAISRDHVTLALRTWLCFAARLEPRVEEGEGEGVCVWNGNEGYA
jgi:hypothetical protein